jgi:hypothetical protein
MFMREFFDAGVAPARGLILARSRAVARWAKAVGLICLLASLLPSAYAQTTTRGFGNGANQFTMDFVTIGNPNNPADTTGNPNPVGSVAYTYNLGKHEVSRDMINKANTAGGLGITLPDMTSFGGNGTNRPATGISWYEAARFVNWLNTNQGYPAAYKFSGTSFAVWTNGDVGYQAGNPYRNTQARYFLPSSDEWYKGAYGSPAGTWYNFATGSDANPTAVIGGTNASTAVYSQTSATGPADITNAGGLSAYGTMAQSGNIHEWMETATDGINNSAAENRDWRGGRWTDGGSSNLNASSRFNSPPTDESATILGFRVASADLTALDSDGDGLSDAVETGTGIYVSPTDTGTDPNNTDTDRDGINDGVEVSTLGTNPNGSQVPGNLVTQQSSSAGFVATWGVVTGATGYEVQVSTEPSFTSGLIGGDRPVSLGTTTSLAVTGLSNQIRYYRIRSVIASIEGPVKTGWSAGVSAPDMTSFGKYVSLNATGNTDNFQPAASSSPNSNSYTITFWMRPDKLGGASGTENVQVIRQAIISGAGTANVDLDLLPDGSLCFGQKDAAGISKFVQTAAKTVLASNWHHVALVRDSTNSTLRIYLNGQDVATNLGAFGLTSWTINNSLGFGATQDALNDDNNLNRFKGAMDDVRVYRAVRTPAQIIQDLSAPLAPAEASANSALVFYAPMEGSSLIDTDTSTLSKGSFNAAGSGTITSQSVTPTPILSWTPSPINLNAPAVLSTNELTASAQAPTGGPVAGSWSYLPAAGTSLAVGTNQVVGTFVPADLNSYSIGTITNQIVVASYPFTYTNNGTNRTITGYTGTGGNVEIPTTIGGLPVTGIGDEAFKNITSITSLTLPIGVTAIGQKAFEGCTQLISISIPNSVATIGQFAFASCSSLTSITLPTSLTSLSDYLFQGCGALTAIVIPNGVTTIGANAFADCANLASVTLPNTVMEIKSGAFFLCPKLTSITIPASVSTIGGNAFLNSSTLASVTFLRNTPPTIGENAFAGIASGAKGYYPATASAPWSGITGLSLEPMLTFPETAFAVTFNGSSTQREIDPRPVQDDFTLAFWIKTAQAGTGSTYWWEGRGLLDGEVGGATNDFGTSLMAGGKIGFGVGPADTTVKSTKSVNNGAWHHVVATRKASSGLMNIYVDGVLDSFINGATGTKNAPSRLTLGSLQTNLNYFQGEMADFRIYDREISAADVWLLANRLSVSGSAAVATLLIDADSDGLDDAIDPDPTKPDTDQDGLTDGQEVNTYGTNPSLADTDSDGVNDKLEVQYGTSPTVSTVFNRLINGSFEDGILQPSSKEPVLTTLQDNVPGWKTTASDSLIELWYSGFQPYGSGGSAGGDGYTLAELNANQVGTLYQDVTMTVETAVSYSFLHRGRSGEETIEFRIDRLVGGPGSAVEANANFFNQRFSTGNGAWVRYRGTPAGTVQAGKTYRFSYISISPGGTSASGNLLDGASFEIDQDADGLTDSVETNTGTDPLDFDSDDDGLKDGEEVITYDTNPLLADTDGDGAPDGVEVTAGTNPKDSASAPNLPIAYNDAFTAKLVVGMTTKVTTASLISNDKYSSIPGETRGVTFVSAQPTSSGGASIRIKGGWLIYQPSSSARIGTSDTFTYTVSNGARDAAGALKTATGTVTVSLVSPDMTIEVALVSPATPANAYKATFLVMPELVFEAYGSDTPDGTYTKIGTTTWTSVSSGKLEVTDTAAAGKSSRFYKLKWIP